MTMIYAIMGTTFIRFVDPDNFGTFSVSMYTMWRIMTFDNAASITLDIMSTVRSARARARFVDCLSNLMTLMARITVCPVYVIACFACIFVHLSLLNWRLLML
jgi:ABC-type transport system involved in cytochrome bd biosynthesis fused ATPase/permease subunit